MIHIACTGKMKKHKFRWKAWMEKDHLWDTDTDEMMILKLILKKWCVKVWT